MRIDRFFINQQLKNGERIVVTDTDLVNRWRNVLRLKPGAEMILFDGSGYEYPAGLSEYADDGAIVQVGEGRAGFVPPRDVTIFMATIKKDKFEWVAEKATELGVSRIVPVRADNSVKQNLRFDRLEKIVRQAAEQSERATLPNIGGVVGIDEALSSAPTHSCALAAREEDAQHVSVTGMLAPKQAGLFIGPEGGWSERELNLFEENDISRVSLGEQILRAETAAVAATACVTICGATESSRGE